MTHTADLPDLAVIDAWLDGEPIASPDVDAVLSTAEGRAYAIDVLRLRRVCLHDPAPAPVVRASRWRPLAAAAAVVVTALGAFVAGQHWARTGPPTVAQATASRDITAAPEPTRVIQFEVGVDWRETTGGN